MRFAGPRSRSAVKIKFLERQLERREAARQLEDFLARYDHGDLRDSPEAVFFMSWARGRLARLGDDLMLEALEERYAKVGLINDADIPSWKTME